MSRRVIAAASVALTLLALAACGRAATDPASTTAAPSGDASGSAAPAAELAITTPPGTGQVESLKWSVYRDVQTLDPLYVFDYPDNTGVTLACESLSLQSPDGSITDGLAALTSPDDKTLVYDINPDATFSDGTPVTADDVVFSLERQRNPELGGFYGQVFTRVESIEATGDKQVTIKLMQPDYWLTGELASIPGIVIQKKAAEAAGPAYGTGEAGVMCTGPYTNSGWSAGSGAVFERNDAYWRSDVKPLVGSITLVGVADPTALTTGLVSGDIQGNYVNALGSVKQLEGKSEVTVTRGVSYVTDAFITSEGNGVLTDPVVRKALSMAIDRRPYIATALEGYAELPRTLASPGTWGYGRDVFAAAYAELPEMVPDIEGAKALVAGKGIEGKTLTIGFIQVPSLTAAANAVKQGAEALGMKVELKAIPADAYINLFIDPEFRKGIDGWFTLNYPNYADPAGLYATFGLPEGSQNYNGYDSPAVTAALEAARGTADPEERAKKVADAQKILTEELPWIPLSFPENISITSSGLTGQTASFSYMFAPWANQLGAR